MKTIGKREVLSILDLELYNLDAKVDTGADSNALHCDNIQIDDINNSVSFSLLDEVHPAYHGKHFTMPLHSIKKVRSSNGELQLRPAILVEIAFYGNHYSSVISLTDRSDMKFPMLIGRKFIAGKFLVDVSQELLTLRG